MSSFYGGGCDGGASDEEHGVEDDVASRAAGVMEKRMKDEGGGGHCGSNFDGHVAAGVLLFPDVHKEQLHQIWMRNHRLT